MANAFYRPEIAREIHCQSLEDRIISAKGETKEISYKEIIEVIDWFNEVIRECYLTKDMVDNRIKFFRKRTKDMLSLPAVHECLNKQLTFSDLSFGDETLNELSRCNLSTVTELCNLSEEELVSHHHLKGGILRDIKEKLSVYGIKIGESVDNGNEDLGKEELEQSLESFQKMLEEAFDNVFGKKNDAEEN